MLFKNFFLKNKTVLKIVKSFYQKQSYLYKYSYINLNDIKNIIKSIFLITKLF